MSISDFGDLDGLREELEKTQAQLADIQADYNEQKMQLNDARAALAGFTREIVATELDSNVFPPGLVVKSFVPGQHLKVSMTGVTLVERGVVAVFGLVWTGGLSSILVGAKVPIYIAVIVFLTVYWFAFLRNPTINFDFQKRRVTMAGLGSVTWREFQPITVDTVLGRSGWSATLKLGSRRIVRFRAENTSEATTDKVTDFVRALNWQMGVPLFTVNRLAQMDGSTYRTGRRHGPE